MSKSTAIGAFTLFYIGYSLLNIDHFCFLNIYVFVLGDPVEGDQKR